MERLAKLMASPAPRRGRPPTRAPPGRSQRRCCLPSCMGTAIKAPCLVLGQAGGSSASPPVCCAPAGDDVHDERQVCRHAQEGVGCRLAVADPGYEQPQQHGRRVTIVFACKGARMFSLELTAAQGRLSCSILEL